MHLGFNKVAAQATSKLNVGLHLLTSFEPHHLVSFAFVLRVTKRFLFLRRPPKMDIVG